tara:strand:+ start:89 stop:610 length:522 start_codon:yes stop_codon:yes gene_type:complete
MDEQEKLKFRKIYAKFSERKLIEMLLADKSVYQPGCYELLNNEMIRRGIEDKVQSIRKKQENKKGRKLNITKPSIFSIFSVLLVLSWPLCAVLSVIIALIGAAISIGPLYGLGIALFIVLGYLASIIIPIIGSVLAFIGLIKNSKDYFAYLGLILNIAIIISKFSFRISPALK